MAGPSIAAITGRPGVHVFQQDVQVAASAEHAGAAGEHQHADVGVIAHPLQHCHQIGAQFGIERVVPGRPRHSDPTDMAVDLEFESVQGALLQAGVNMGILAPPSAGLKQTLTRWPMRRASRSQSTMLVSIVMPSSKVT